MLRFRPRGDLRRDAGGEMMYFEDGMFLLFFPLFLEIFCGNFGSRYLLGRVIMDGLN